MDWFIASFSSRWARSSYGSGRTFSSTILNSLPVLGQQDIVIDTSCVIGRTSGLTSPSSENQMLRLLNSAAQKREVKATQNLSIIVAFFMICWFPLYTINTINAFCKECFINAGVTYFGIILSHLNSAINPLLYAYHLKDFRGALLRLFTCNNDQDAFYQPSLVSQQQQRITSQLNQRRAYQPRIYIDSPVWRRQQPVVLKAVTERKSNDCSSDFYRDIELSNSAPSQSPAFQSQHSSHSNKIFIISDNHTTETDLADDPQSSSLYSIVNRRKEVECVD